jgi:hypothetical protein
MDRCVRCVYRCVVLLSLLLLLALLCLRVTCCTVYVRARMHRRILKAVPHGSCVYMFCWFWTFHVVAAAVFMLVK